MRSRASRATGAGRRRSLALDLHKLAPEMRPAECERPGQGVRTRLSHHGLVSLIAVAVDDAAIAFEQSQAMNGAAAWCIGIDHAGRIRPGPRPVIARQRPEVA